MIEMTLSDYKISTKPKKGGLVFKVFIYWDPGGNRKYRLFCCYLYRIAGELNSRGGLYQEIEPRVLHVVVYCESEKCKQPGRNISHRVSAGLLYIFLCEPFTKR